MKAFRLAIVRQKYRPDGEVERFISHAQEALTQQNLDLSVISRKWPADVNPNGHIHLCNPIKFGRINRERGFADAARTLWQKENFDLVQSHERIAGCDIYRAGDGVYRRWLLQRARLLPEWRRKWLFSNRYHRSVMCAERALYAAQELKAVICNANMIKQEIIDDFGIRADKITVIYNAIDHQTFLPASEQQRQQLRAQYQIPLPAHCLIFVGSDFACKGLAMAIRAIAPTESYLLVVGKDKAEKRYRALAQSLGCSNRVRFIGAQKHTLPFYQAADALLLPALYAPFPNVILEAMSCGLPVITSTTCGGAEFITPGENGFVSDALDANALTDAIHALPQQALGSNMAAAARLRIMPATPARLSQQLIELYNQLLG
ncbi:glycosyl transferase family 1 [Chania multitudinisentens RB-25]|uniref:Glycosyl transferase family 1 n=1 Tax=Chania multitudinisentens RB-25 TaxID=1441930 RepID=W0L8W2_9GAMM|nr:glycosyltransferase family 4 protein [Chania multitudinisentens]AHG20181.1 glycosyl transferase family 1 [Chania multitudinisentens RB-25]